MSEVRAWRLDPGPFAIAISHTDLVEVIAEPEVRPLPVGPKWCRELLAWRGLYLPLARLDGSDDGAGLAVVIAARVADDGRADYVAMRVKRPPEAIPVAPGSDCEPPKDSRIPRKHLLACFKHNDEVIAVPDLAALFALDNPPDQQTPPASDAAEPEATEQTGRTGPS